MRYEDRLDKFLAMSMAKKSLVVQAPRVQELSHDIVLIDFNPQVIYRSSKQRRLLPVTLKTPGSCPL